MLNVPSAVITHYLSNNYKKGIRIHFQDGDIDDITNDNIVYESFTFKESTCSSSSFSFGLCEKSSIEFETVGIQNILDKIIECYIEIDTSDEFEENTYVSQNVGNNQQNTSVTIRTYTAAGRYITDEDNCNTTIGDEAERGVYSIPLGVFKVESCPRNKSNMDHRNVTACSTGIKDNTSMSDFTRWQLAQLHKNEEYILYLPQFIDCNVKRFNWKNDYVESDPTYDSNRPFAYIKRPYTKDDYMFVTYLMSDDYETVYDVYIGPGIAANNDTGTAEEMNIISFIHPNNPEYQQTDYPYLDVTKNSGSVVGEMHTNFTFPAIYSIENSISDEDYIQMVKDAVYSACDLQQTFAGNFTQHGYWEWPSMKDDVNKSILSTKGILYWGHVMYSAKIQKMVKLSKDQPIYLYDAGLNSTGHFGAINSARVLICTHNTRNHVDGGAPSFGYFNSQIRKWQLARHTISSDQVPNVSTKFHGMKLKIKYNLDKEKGAYRYSFYNAFTFKDILNGFVEMHGMFGIQKRDGTFQIAPVQNLNDSMFYYRKWHEKDYWYDEFDVHPIGYIQFKHKETKDKETVENQIIFRIIPGASYEPGDSVYDMSNNAVFNFLDYSYKIVGCALYYAFISGAPDVNFDPVDMSVIGLPFIEAGDAIDVEVKINDSGATGPIHTYVLNRTMKGIQSLTDDIVSESGDIINNEDYEEGLPDDSPVS